MRRILIVLSIVLCLLGCRGDITREAALEDITTYAGLFDAWWYKMNTNYLFWDLDSPGSEWDEVYDEYMPRFEAYGAIEGSSLAVQDQVIRDFCSIVRPLSDGHYTMKMSLPDRDVSIAPSSFRAYMSAGLSYEEAYDSIILGNKEKYDAYMKSAVHNEYAYGIVTDCFGVSAPSGSPSYRPYGPVSAGDVRLGRYFTEAGYLVAPAGYSIMGNDFSEFTVFLGRTEDGILYFSLSSFMISALSSLASEGNRDAANAMTLINLFLDAIHDPEGINGVVIDLRGNGGGQVTDLDLLWRNFAEDRVKIAETRGKKTGNRLSYGSWQDFYVKSDASADFDRPIAVLVNKRSASCAEFSTLFFMAFRDDHGGNVRIFGDTTMGAQGPWLGISDVLLGSGTFFVEPYISLVMTPFNQVRPYDGIMREGDGIVPDDTSVAFSYEDFMSGNDARLNKALEWVRSEV